MVYLASSRDVTKVSGPRRSSVPDESRPRPADPLLERRTAPLQSGVVDESFGNWIAEHDQSLQHHREIDIRDRPVAKEIVRASIEQGECRGE